MADPRPLTLNDLDARLREVEALQELVLKLLATTKPLDRVLEQYGATETQAVKWAVEVYKPILDYAAAKGIVLGLEDDDDLTRTSAQLLTIVKQVNHPAARIALDCGNFRKDGYKECEICAPYASSTHVKPQMSTPDGQREPADWAKLFGILANAGYRGYVSLELSTPDNPVPKYAAELMRCARMYSGA